eukprot:m51a1_g13862 putative synembryn-a isoform x2 (446) ;mRNA; r:602132-603835
MQDVTRALRAHAASGEWVPAVEQWCQQEKDTWAFVPPNSADDKRALVAALWDVLRAPGISPAHFDTASRALRLLLREGAAIEPTADAACYELFARRAGLVATGGAGCESADVASEALKVAINLVTRHAGHRALAVALGAQAALVRALERAAGGAEEVFLACRMLVQLSLAEEHARALRALHGVRAATRAIAAAQAAAGARWPPGMHVTEACKLLFNLTVGLGPLAPARAEPEQEDLESYSALLPLYLRVLQGGQEGGQTDLGRLRQAVISNLVNSPKGWHALVGDDVVREAVRALLGVLASSLRDPLTVEVFLPVTVILCGVMEEMDQLRGLIYDTVFPPEYRALCNNVQMDAPDAMERVNCLAGPLSKLMTSLNITIKHMTQEFLFAACDKDPNELCRLVGVGNAAGLLQSHGLLMFGSEWSPVDPDTANTLMKNSKDDKEGKN